MKTAAFAVAVALLAALIAIAGNDWAVAHSQDALPAPANVNVSDRPNTGAAIIAWDEVDGAAYYLIGWVDLADARSITDAGGDWQIAFTSINLERALVGLWHSRPVPGS